MPRNPTPNPEYQSPTPNPQPPCGPTPIETRELLDQARAATPRR